MALQPLYKLLKNIAADKFKLFEQKNPARYKQAGFKIS
jgi:hypothetical protein